MGTIVYLSIRLACACYILYKVCGQKNKIREICDLLYTKFPPRKRERAGKCLVGTGRRIRHYGQHLFCLSG